MAGDCRIFSRKVQNLVFWGRENAAQTLTGRLRAFRIIGPNHLASYSGKEKGRPPEPETTLIL